MVFVLDVLVYGDILKIKGLILFSVFGNDLIVFLVFVAVGCYIVLFIIGRGMLFGIVVLIVKVLINIDLF